MNLGRHDVRGPRISKLVGLESYKGGIVMPPENSLPFEEPELYAETDDGWVRIGKVSEITEITPLEEDVFIPISPLPNTETFTVNIKSIQGEFSNKAIRWFRKNLGIDLLYMKFPKNKNRRKKRLWRNAKKVFRSF